jgi:hypothetical protein
MMGLMFINTGYAFGLHIISIDEIGQYVDFKRFQDYESFNLSVPRYRDSN